MKFTKPALDLDAQVDQLFARGMLGDRERMRRRLRYVNYYRLSAYWHTFRVPGGEDFLPGTNFEEVWTRYAFDRALRVLTMDALERVEVATRALLARELATRSGPFAYADDPTVLFPGDARKRADFLARLQEDLDRSHEAFVPHFKAKYGDQHPWPPIWLSAEVLSFGGMLSLYRGSPQAVRDAVAAGFGVPELVLESWLLHLNVVRNICAHHARLWNREVRLRPKVPRPHTHPEWHRPVAVSTPRVFATLTVLAHCLGRIAPGTTWACRFAALLQKNPSVPHRQMGIPEGWETCPIWARLLANG